MRQDGVAPRLPVDVLFYIHSFDGGGAERVTLQLADHWHRAGRSVVVVVNRDGGAIRRLLDPDVPVIVLDPLRTFLAVVPLGRLLRRLRPRIVVSALTFCNIAAGLARPWRDRNGKMLLVEHSDLSTGLAALSPMRRWWYRLAVPLAYRRASHLAGVSIDAASHAAQVARLPGPRVTVLHNPVWRDPATDRPAAAVHPWLAGPDPVFVTAGRLVAVKNHHLLLDALAIFRRRRSARLIVLGEGPLRDRLRRRAEELGIGADVDFAGFRNDVGDFLRLADGFVLSSDSEALPLVLLEALQHSIAVVATDCSSGPREILGDGRLGVLVPVRDAAALAEGMRAALEMPVSRADRDRVLAHYSIDEAARRYLDHLGESDR